MASMKIIFYLLLITLMAMTSATPSRRGERIHFQDSAELAELDEDQHLGSQHRNRNHRGRGTIHQTPNSLPQFEQGIPGYPIRGPVQAPLVLPNSQQGQNYPPTTTVRYETPIFATQPKVESQTPKNYHYAGNPFLPKVTSVPQQTSTANYETPVFATQPRRNSQTPTNYPPTGNPFLTKLTPVSPGLTTNQLPSSDKPLTTTPNPRLTNLLYGSNLLEEEKASRGPAEATATPDFSVIDRGLFDTAPHCKSNEILVGNKCRMAV